MLVASGDKDANFLKCIALPSFDSKPLKDEPNLKLRKGEITDVFYLFSFVHFLKCQNLLKGIKWYIEWRLADMAEETVFFFFLRHTI